MCFERVSHQLGVIFFVIIMLIYGWLGGMRSVAYTDTIQGFALLIGVFLLLIGSIIYFGGVPTSTDYMRAYSPEKIGIPDAAGVRNWLSLLLLIGIGAAVYPHAIQRIFAAKSEKTLKRSFSRMAWMPFVTAGVVFLIGIIGINAFPGLSTGDSEQLVGMMASTIASQNALFYWAMILLFGGVIAAIVSTADSILLTFSSIISNDLYGNYINPKASQRKKLLVGKLAGVVAVGILILIAWFPPATLYQIFVLKFELLIQISPGFILGLYWNRLHPKAVFAGMFAGTAVASVMTVLGLSWLNIASGLWGLLLNLSICVLGSLMMTVSEKEENESEQVISV
ncbi:sodium:solute symporter family protein [Lentibacillus jeotgali]|uniref:sodium:solute symporter family protein n=1 Tax=Lentibacillus jeotgali TaxID=558169 RepID=UPI0002FB1546|nr:sodium:solute symporter family protein [Lentibacillus jeotgali]